jgi:hypothetical protein
MFHSTCTVRFPNATAKSSNNSAQFSTATRPSLILLRQNLNGRMENFLATPDWWQPPEHDPELPDYEFGRVWLFPAIQRLNSFDKQTCPMCHFRVVAATPPLISLS